MHFMVFKNNIWMNLLQPLYNEAMRKKFFGEKLFILSSATTFFLLYFKEFPRFFQFFFIVSQDFSCFIGFSHMLLMCSTHSTEINTPIFPCWNPPHVSRCPCFSSHNVGIHESFNWWRSSLHHWWEDMNWPTSSQALKLLQFKTMTHRPAHKLTHPSSFFSNLNCVNRSEID